MRRPTPIRLVWLDGRDYIVDQSLMLHFRHRDPVLLEKKWIDGVVHGFVTDGGSVPRLAWPLAGHPLSKRLHRYIKHDGCFSLRDLIGLSFSDANEELYYDCLDAGDPMPLAYSIWKSVQYGGRGVWRRGAARANDLSWHYAPIPGVAV